MIDEQIEELSKNLYKQKSGKIYATDNGMSNIYYVNVEHEIKSAIKTLIDNEVTKAIDSYTNALHEWGYIDSDFYIEEPSPQSRFAHLTSLLGEQDG